jgi:crotonobetainyl-CoA:carnitine CoA-transferase CaiB-like acyl-CoA transferase
MGDHVTGLALTAGIVTALFDRHRTGRGQLVETSLMRAGSYIISSDLAAQMSGRNVQLGMRRMIVNPLFACYRAGDGRWFFLIGLQAMRHLPGVLRAVGREDMVEDERFSNFAELMAHRQEMVDLLDVEFSTRPLSEWAERFAEEDVWWDPVQDLEEVLNDDLFRGSGSVRDNRDGGTTVAPPVDLERCVLDPAEPAPEVGQHTEEVLLELGYDWDGIGRLRDHGAI